jgi:hypothetical protein
MKVKYDFKLMLTSFIYTIMYSLISLTSLFIFLRKNENFIYILPIIIIIGLNLLLQFLLFVYNKSHYFLYIENDFISYQPSYFKSQKIHFKEIEQASFYKTDLKLYCVNNNVITISLKKILPITRKNVMQELNLRLKPITIALSNAKENEL